MTGKQLDPFLFDFTGGAMGQGLPVGDLAAQVKRKPADAEIGIPVRKDQVDLRIGRQLPARRPALIPASLPPMITNLFLIMISLPRMTEQNIHWDKVYHHFQTISNAACENLPMKDPERLS